MSAIDLGYRPRDWQRECHLQRKRFTVLALHRRAGKTELALAELIDKALRFDKDLGLFFYIAPQLKQAKAIAWARLLQRLDPLIQQGLVTKNEGELWVKFTHNGAMIRVYGADNPDAMRGVRLDGVVIDEVAQTKPEVWQDIVQPALSDRKGWAIFIGTPNGINLFSELFYRARGLEDWHSALYTVYDTQALDEAEVARLKATMPEQSFRREFLCDFSAAGDNQLLSLSDIMAAQERKLQPADWEWAPRVVGVDPARFGDDRSVIYRRQGLNATFKPAIYLGIDNMALAAQVARCVDEWQADACYIDAGNGAGVIDRLRQLGYEVIEVNFGGKPTLQRFVNKRSEMWMEMRDWVLAGGALAKDIELRQDLAAPAYSYDLTDRIALESKDDLRKRGLPSPDVGDALALTFAFPTAKKPLAHRLGIRTPQRTDYNPVEYASVGLRGVAEDYDPLDHAFR